MQVPHFVRRSAGRALAAGAAGAVIVALIGVAGERATYGGDLAAARARVAAGVQQQITDLSARLEAETLRLRQDPRLAAAVQSGDLTTVRALFDLLADAAARLDMPGAAFAAYGGEGRLVAWAGRPAPVPAARLEGPDAVFLARSSTGLRLTRVVPIPEPDAADRTMATLVAEVPLSRAPDVVADGNYVLPIDGVPVSLRLSFEQPPETAAGNLTVRTPSGVVLATIDVDAGALAAARARWRARVLAAEAGVLTVVLLLLCGPLLDWRRVLSSVRGHLLTTTAIVTLLVVARMVAWAALRLAAPGAVALVPPNLAGGFFVLLASPADFILTALLFGALVALAAGSFEQWRHGRRRRARAVPDAGGQETLVFIAVQVLAGVVAGVLLVVYQDVLRERLSHMPVDVLHFSLHPLEPARLAVAMGLVVVHAALLALVVLIFRVALARWVVGRHRPWLRAGIPLVWAAAGALAVAAVTRDWSAPPLWPTAIVLVAGGITAWRQRRYRAQLEHASQATRLAALFVMLAMPSIVFYPSVVDAAGRARRQLIETRFAPEVVNQRLSLQTRLQESMAQIDALPDLPELVAAGDAVPAGPVPYETAFRVWERTVLEDQRLTSSVELHDLSGSLLSRFALKLPTPGGPQFYQESTCDWEVFEEVSPFFAEERRLLHAGRGICRDGVSGRLVVGSIAIHVMLDYSNLSFISAQSPYAALLRGDEEHVEPTPGEAIEFTVYGWSRRPLYSSDRTPWPLTESVFQRIFASRAPVWARVESDDDEHEVYFLNDRGGIYALGYAVTSPFGHLIRLAEVLVLSAATFVLLLVAGFVYGFIATRVPASGRALLREVRASFYRKLFIAFVAASVVPVLALALVTRAYIASLMQEDLEMEAARTAASASRVVEDVGVLELTGAASPGIVDDDLVVWLSRVIAQDVNIFDRSGLIASSERSLFAYGLLPRSTQGDVYRAIIVDGRPSYVTREAVGTTEYLVAAAPVRVQNRQAILTVPLTLRQQEIEAQVDELDRRVLLGAVLFIFVGAGLGYSMAERIADPVNRLTRATGRIARGDLDARILATSADEFRRLVEAFNQMAADLQRQRVELERSNRLAAWADMARQVAHDIKNPLTPIQLNAEHLRRVHEDRGAPLGHVLDECVDHVLQQVRLLRQIASEFSSFASSPTVSAAPVALGGLIDEVVRPYRTGLKGQVVIENEVPDSLPPVMADRGVLARAVTNVIENALHAMPRGGTLRLVGAAQDGAGVELAIADTGIGMDEADLERIFEPYFSTRGSGTGLGLTIAKRNVELNGGTIAVESARGRGTTVRITLPTAPGAA